MNFVRVLGPKERERVEESAEPEAAAPPTAAKSVPGEGEAERMVREFHAFARGDELHVPLRREVAMAKGLLRAHGVDAWDHVSAAMRTLQDQVRRGGPAAATFLYLGPHLTRMGVGWGVVSRSGGGPPEAGP